MANKHNPRRRNNRRNRHRTEYHTPDPYKQFMRLDKPQPPPTEDEQQCIICS